MRQNLGVNGVSPEASSATGVANSAPNPILGLVPMLVLIYYLQHFRVAKICRSPTRKVLGGLLCVRVYKIDPPPFDP